MAIGWSWRPDLAPWLAHRAGPERAARLTRQPTSSFQLGRHAAAPGAATVLGSPRSSSQRPRASAQIIEPRMDAIEAIHQRVLERIQHVEWAEEACDEPKGRHYGE